MSRKNKPTIDAETRRRKNVTTHISNWDFLKDCTTLLLVICEENLTYADPHVMEKLPHCPINTFKNCVPVSLPCAMFNVQFNDNVFDESCAVLK